MKLDKHVIEELEFDPESINNIIQVIDHNAMSLQHCAKICKIMAPLCNYLTAGGAIDWL